MEVARLLANTRCSNVRILDATGISPITDYMVLGTGTSPRQMKSVADDVQELGESHRNRALSRVGDESSQWIAVDFVDVVAHIFSAESRNFYDLDNLWGDAKIVEWEQPATAAKK
jgi:ribosome-associated protein